MHPALVLFPLAASLLLLQDHASADCEPATCGNLTLRYPFWLGSGNQTSSPCGHPSFEIWCSDDHRRSVASLKGSSIHVLSIDYANYSFVASHTRVAAADGVCRTDFNMSVSIALSPFTISPRNRALCFLYNCTGGAAPIGPDEYVNATSSCRAPIYAYLGGAYYWDKPPAIASDGCTYTYIPVLGREAETMTAANYSRLLKDGFVLKWEAAGIGDCAACNARGGKCRYDNATAAFRCLCPDGRRAAGSTCSVTLASFPRSTGRMARGSWSDVVFPGKRVCGQCRLPCRVLAAARSNRGGGLPLPVVAFACH
ncbi:hypothetical protein SETIT_5G093600v2 [Setaria italica]|uniref:Wall-associated receptor kinase galacturonan-binding domain-containing protein n=1 Tax=Setaria italica TaxID=4555 RepID=A0A368R321_SETIT|nr:hypothetical protein SETIT_5G093600v2 [Setaria italica]